MPKREKTMLIDIHTHVLNKDHWPEGMKRAAARRAARSTFPFGDPKVIKEASSIYDVLHDPQGDRWIRDMELLGIDAGVCQTNDFGAAEGWGEEAVLPIEEINRQVYRLTRKYPGKLLAFVGVNPKRRCALEIVEEGVKKWGAKGVKLLPHTGFYPNDRSCYRLYEKCVELGVPVTIHTGQAPFRHIKYTNPIHLDEPSQDFPELEFIMAHVGGGIGFMWEEAVTVSRFNPNISFDLAEVAPTVIKGGWRGNKGKYKDHIPAFLDMLDIMRNALAGGCLNILFGTDYPFYPIEVVKEWVELFKNLPTVAAKYGYDFSQDEVDQMCYKNAARLLKLDIGENGGVV